MAIIKYITFGDGTSYSLAKLFQFMESRHIGRNRSDWRSLSEEEFESARVSSDEIERYEEERRAQNAEDASVRDANAERED